MARIDNPGTTADRRPRQHGRGHGVTLAIELLKTHVPVLSLGVLYIFAALPIAIFWGLVHVLAVVGSDRLPATLRDRVR